MDWPNGDPWLQTGRGRGGHPLAATGATAAEQAHLGHIRAEPGATRCAHRPAAGSATRREIPPRISGRWSADRRWCDPGSDAASGRRRGGFCAAGDPSPGAGRSGFCPCEGGFDELPGVFGGRVSSLSRASSAAMRASCAAMWRLGRDPLSANASRAVSAAISASFSGWLSWAGAGSSGTRRVESTRP